LALIGFGNQDSRRKPIGQAEGRVEVNNQQGFKEASACVSNLLQEEKGQEENLVAVSGR